MPGALNEHTLLKSHYDDFKKTCIWETISCWFLVLKICFGCISKYVPQSFS